MKRSAIVIKFRRYTCAVCRAVYGNGQTALWLEDVNSGERIAVATVALDVPLPKDQRRDSASTDRRRHCSSHRH